MGDDFKIGCFGVVVLAVIALSYGHKRFFDSGYKRGYEQGYNAEKAAIVRVSTLPTTQASQPTTRVSTKPSELEK